MSKPLNSIFISHPFAKNLEVRLMPHEIRSRVCKNHTAAKHKPAARKTRTLDGGASNVLADRDYF